MVEFSSRTKRRSTTQRVQDAQDAQQDQAHVEFEVAVEHNNTDSTRESELVTAKIFERREKSPPIAMSGLR